MSKHLLLEIEVSDDGATNPQEVAIRLEDAIFQHMKQCTAREEERKLFVSDAPRIRVLTEDVPV